MLTDKTKKRQKLSFEILIIVATCFVLSIILFLLVSGLTPRLVEEYCFVNDIALDDYQLYRLDVTVYSAGIIVSVGFFVVMFSILFGEQLAYIRKITRGIDEIRNGNYGSKVEILGNNELTGLAEAVNYLSESEKNAKEKERLLKAEREELIRTLSHDIRTPLTSIMLYSQLLSSKEILTADEYKEYISLVNSKTHQIKELTDILLDGGMREVERFEDARLLFSQLADEFESELEYDFKLTVDLSSMSSFEGRFDVGEMRRIFDNLISNIVKYADPTSTVELYLSNDNKQIIIRQSNGIRKDRLPSESFRMGLNSIRRIAYNYEGTMETFETNGKFEIVITLSNL